MDGTFKLLYSRTREYLKDVDWSRYEEILFLSKSIGTVMSAALAEELGEKGKKIRQILYTPLEYTFRFHPQDAIGFVGTRDSHVVTSQVVQLAEEQGIPMQVYEGAGHSLETGNVLRDLEIMQDVMAKTREFVKNNSKDEETR